MEGAALVAVPLSAPVRQAAVVPHHGEGGGVLLFLKTEIGPRRGVVHPGPAPQPPLEGGGIFPDVVGQARQLRLGLPTEGGSKFPGQAGGPRQVGMDRLCSAVLRDMGKKCVSHRKSPLSYWDSNI